MKLCLVFARLCLAVCLMAIGTGQHENSTLPSLQSQSATFESEDYEDDSPMDFPMRSNCILADPCRSGSSCVKRCLIYKHLKPHLDEKTLKSWFQLPEDKLAEKVKQWIAQRELEDENIEKVMEKRKTFMARSDAEKRYTQCVVLFVALSVLQWVIIPLVLLTIICQELINPVKPFSKKEVEEERRKAKAKANKRTNWPPSPWAFAKLVYFYLLEKTARNDREEMNLEKYRL